MNRARIATLTIPMMNFATAAAAHPGHPAPGIVAGLAHPLTGGDHVLAMLAVGLWAAQTGGRAVWALPAAFLAAMATGGALGMAGWSGAAVEPVILASVVCLGAAVALALRAPLVASLPMVAVFGMAHGVAHGAEAGMAGAGYALGFLAATLALHGAGLAIAGLAAKIRADALPRLLGGTTVAAGLALVTM